MSHEPCDKKTKCKKLAGYSFLARFLFPVAGRRERTIGKGGKKNIARVNVKMVKSKRSVLFWMTAVLFTAVFVGVHISHFQHAAHIHNNSTIIHVHDGNRNQSISYATYTTANFTMNYPANWTVVPTASKILFVSKNGYEGGYITLDIQLLSSIESGGIYNSVDDVVADLVQRFPGGAKNVSNVTINYEREEMLGGAKGKEVSISYIAHNIKLYTNANYRTKG